MSRASGSTPGNVSLFPFLAVLVCAMGALILLLIAMTQKIRLQEMAKHLAGRLPVASISAPDTPPAHRPVLVPQQEPAAPGAHTPAEPAAPIIAPAEADPAAIAAQRARQAAWEQELGDLQQERDRILAALQQRRSSNLRTKSQLQFEQEELERLKHAQHRQRLEAQQLSEAEQALRAQQVQVEQRIALTRRNIDAARRQLSQASGAYALMPYDGQSGTYRRPIYIECTDEGLRVLPENIFLDPETLDGFTEAYNPLLAATQTLTQHWNRERERLGKSEPEPYVLLLVRPSGTIAYYVARKLLTRSNTPFGYELIEEDWQLDFPEADPVAKSLAHDAVAKTLRAKAEVLASLGGQPRRNGEPAAAQGARRSFPEIVELGETAGVSRRPAAAGESRPAGADTPAGSRPTPDVATAATDGQSQVPEIRPGTANRGRTPNGSRNGNSATQPAAGPAQIGLGEDGTRPVRGPASSLSPEEIREELAAASRANSAAGRNESASLPAGKPLSAQRGLPQESGQWRTEFKPGAEPGGLLDKSRSSRTLDRHLDNAGFTPAGMLEDNAGSAGTGAGSLPPAEASLAGPNRASLDTLPPHGSAASAGRTKGMTASSDLVPGQHSPRQVTGPGDTPQIQPHSDLIDHRPPAATGTEPASTGAAASSAGMGATTNRNTFSARETELTSSPSADPRSGPPGRSGPRDPKRWAAPGRGTIGLEKKIEVHVLPDKVLIGPYDVTVRIVRGETKEELVNKMMDGIERAAATWGRPPANFYWLPSIKFVVFPGGSQHYERIHGALREWGINSQVEYTGGEAARTSKIPHSPKNTRPIPQ